MGLVGLYGLALHRLTCPELPLTSGVPTSMDRGRQVENGLVRCRLVKSVLSWMPNSCPWERRKLLVPPETGPGHLSAVSPLFRDHVASASLYWRWCLGFCFAIALPWLSSQLYLTARKPKLKLPCSLNRISSSLL